MLDSQPLQSHSHDRSAMEGSAFSRSPATGGAQRETPSSEVNACPLVPEAPAYLTPGPGGRPNEAAIVMSMWADENHDVVAAKKPAEPAAPDGQNAAEQSQRPQPAEVITAKASKKSKRAATRQPAEKVARLHAFADVDTKSLGIKDLKQGNVGHAWISLEYLDPTKVPDSVHPSHLSLLRAGGRYSDPMGFWPDINNNVGYSANPFDSYVAGWMSHPDRAHQGSEKARESWDITQNQVDSVIGYAESKRGAKYSVYFYNCTTFVRDSVQAAGINPPSMATLGICYPNALYNGIKHRHNKGVGDTMVKDLDTGVESTQNGREPSRKD